MLDYPSIPSALGQQFREIPDADVFDKKDGSSMRSAWSRRKGWFKHGRRKGLLDSSNPLLEDQMPALFNATLAEPLAKIAHDSRWETCIVFYEFWGAQSIAGLHFQSDPKFLTLFDVAVGKEDEDFLSPRDFRRAFEDAVPTARYLGRVNWTRGYVDLVRSGGVEGITFEGVVAKAATRKGIVRAKAKTQAWIARVIQVHGELAGRRLVES